MLVPPQREGGDGAGVWLPLGLANALMECYYGWGPRYHERGLPRAAPPPPPDGVASVPVEVKEEEPENPPLSETRTWPRSVDRLRGWKRKGRTEVQDPPQEPKPLPTIGEEVVDGSD